MTEQEQQLIQAILRIDHASAPEIAMALVFGTNQTVDNRLRKMAEYVKQLSSHHPEVQEITDNLNRYLAYAIKGTTDNEYGNHPIDFTARVLALLYFHPDNEQEFIDVETIGGFEPEHADERILKTQREFNFYEILSCFRKGSVNGQMNYDELNKGFELLVKFNDISFYDRLLEGCTINAWPYWPTKWIDEYKIAKDGGEFHCPAEIMNRLVLTAPEGTNIDSSFTEDNLLQFYLDHIDECIGNTTSDDYSKILKYWTPKSFFTNFSFLIELINTEIDGVKEFDWDNTFDFLQNYLDKPFATKMIDYWRPDDILMLRAVNKCKGLKNLYNNLSFIQLGNFISLVDAGIGPSTDIEKLNLILISKIHWTQNIQPTHIMLTGNSIKFFSKSTDFYFEQRIWDDLLYQSFLNEMDELIIPEILEKNNEFSRAHQSDTFYFDFIELEAMGWSEESTFSPLQIKLSLLHCEKIHYQNIKDKENKFLNNIRDTFPKCSFIDEGFVYVNNAFDLHKKYKVFIQEIIKKHFTITHNGYNLEVLDVNISHDFKVDVALKLSTIMLYDDSETIVQRIEFGYFLHFNKQGEITFLSQVDHVPWKPGLRCLPLDKSQTNTAMIKIVIEEYDNIFNEVSELAKDQISNFSRARNCFTPDDIIYPNLELIHEKTASILMKISHSDFRCYDIDFSNYPESMKQNKALMHKAIQIYSGNYIYASKELQQNEEFILRTIDALSEEQSTANSKDLLPFIEADSTITNQTKVELWKKRRQDKTFLLDNPHLIDLAASELYSNESFLYDLFTKYLVLPADWDLSFVQEKNRIETELKKCLDLDLKFIYYSISQSIKEDSRFAHTIVDFHLNIEKYVDDKRLNVGMGLVYSLGIEVLNLLLLQYHYNDPELFKKICVMRDECGLSRQPKLVSSLIRKISSMPESANFFLDKHVLKELILAFPNNFLSDLLPHLDSRVHDIIMGHDFHNAVANISKDYAPNIQSEIKLSSQIEDDFYISRITENGHELLFAPDSIRGDIEVIKLTLAQDPKTFRYATPEFLSEKDNVIPFVKRFGFLLEFVSDELKNDSELVELAVKSNAQAIKFASERLKDNEAIAYEAVSQYGNALTHLSPRLKNNERIVNKAIERNGKAIKYASEEIRMNHLNDLIKFMVLDPDIFDYIPDKYKNEKKFILNDIPSVVDKQFLINNESYLLSAIKFDAKVFDWCTESALKSNRGFLNKVVKLNSVVWSLLPDGIRKDKQFINSILEESSDSVFSNSDFMKDAISSNQATISKLGNSLKNNSSFMLELIIENKETLNHIGADLRTNAAFCIEVMRELSLTNIPDVFDGTLSENEEVKVLIPIGGGLATEYAGTVKFFSYYKGMGFIIEDKTNKEYYTDIKSIIDRLETGDKVTFNLKKTEQGMSAINVSVK
jgi:cold shock CspA family protein